MPKIWIGRTTLNGEKKEDGHENKKDHFQISGFALSLALKKSLGDITFRYKIKIITI